MANMSKGDGCEFCQGALEHRLIRARFQFKDHTIYVKHVPAWVCRCCGEPTVDAPVYKRLDEIARHRRRIKKRVSFPLAKIKEVLYG